MIRPLSLLAGVLVLGSVAWAEPLPEELAKKLTAAVRENCPEAKIQNDENGFIAKNGTMMFTVHNHSMTGEYFPQTSQDEGPNNRGFILRVTLHKGPYQEQAAIPQTLRQPYFSTFIDGPATEDGRGYYKVGFSYGAALEEKLKNAIVEAIPKTKFQPAAPAK